MAILQPPRRTFRYNNVRTMRKHIQERSRKLILIMAFLITAFVVNCARSSITIRSLELAAVSFGWLVGWAVDGCDRENGVAYINGER